MVGLRRSSSKLKDGYIMQFSLHLYMFEVFHKEEFF